MPNRSVLIQSICQQEREIDRLLPEVQRLRQERLARNAGLAARVAELEEIIKSGSTEHKSKQQEERDHHERLAQLAQYMRDSAAESVAQAAPPMESARRASARPPLGPEGASRLSQFGERGAPNRGAPHCLRQDNFICGNFHGRPQHEVGQMSWAEYVDLHQTGTFSAAYVKASPNTHDNTYVQRGEQHIQPGVAKLWLHSHWTDHHDHHARARARPAEKGSDVAELCSEVFPP